jgi:hypothetical protein
MSRNGSGTYSLPAGNPVVTGTTITSSWANSTMQNIADALTQSVASDGQTPMSGVLNMATNKIINVSNPTLAQDAATKTYVDAKTDGTASGSFTSLAYSTTLTGGTGVVNLGSGQFYKDASGNVGIGVTPSAWSTANSIKALQIPSGALWNFSTNYLYLGQNYYWNGSNRIYINTDGASEYQQNAGVHSWYTAPSGTAGTTATLTERMRIDSSGNLLVGTTTNPSSGKSGLVCGQGINSRAGYGSTTTTTNAINFYYGGATVALYVDTTSLGAITTASDYRIKRNIETQLDSGLKKILKLRPVTYQIADYNNLFKANDEIKEGFIAHEVQEVIASGAEGIKDDPNQIQSLRVDAILAVAVKAIQEQQAIITDLKSRIEALESK